MTKATKQKYKYVKEETLETYCRALTLDKTLRIKPVLVQAIKSESTAG